MASLTRLGVGGSAAAYKFEPAEVISLDATKGVVTVSGAAGILLSPVAYDAIKGVISIQAKPAASILQASSATKGIVYVVGKQADLLTVESFDNAVSGAVSVSGTTGTLLSSGAYDAIKGVISIQAKPAASILQASSATKGIVYVVGKQAALVDGAAEVLNATAAQITIAGKTAEAVAVMMQALPDSVIIRGNDAEFVQYAILDAISGSVTIAGLPAELRGGTEPADAIAAAVSVLGVDASINDEMIIIPHRSRVLIVKRSRVLVINGSGLQ